MAVGKWGGDNKRTREVLHRLGGEVEVGLHVLFNGKAELNVYVWADANGVTGWSGAVFAVDEAGRVVPDSAFLIQAHCLSSTLVEITTVGGALEALDKWAQGRSSCHRFSVWFDSLEGSRWGRRGAYGRRLAT